MFDLIRSELTRVWRSLSSAHASQQPVRMLSMCEALDSASPSSDLLFTFGDC